MENISANWGNVISKTALFRGCNLLNCTRHGGIVISESVFMKHECFKKIRDMDLSKYRDSNKQFAFEQHLDINIIFACLPKEIFSRMGYSPDRCVSAHESALSAVCNFFPEFFTAITGKELSIFDSFKLRDEFFEEKKLPLLDSFLSGYNIPDGYCAVNFTTNKFKFFLVERKKLDEFIQLKYFKTLPFDMSLIADNQEFIPDFELPRNKPNFVLSNGYYVAHKSKRFNNHIVVLAYNYIKKQKQCFEFKDEQSYLDYFSNKDESVVLLDELGNFDSPLVSHSNIQPNYFFS